MKIGTWNSCGPIGKNRARFLNSWAYDLWALQECEPQPAFDGMHLEALRATNDIRKSIVIASRWPLSQRSDAPGGNAFACVVDAPTPFVFGNLWSFNDKSHSEARSCAYFNWYSSARRMVDFCISVADGHGLPLIVAGDLNSSLGHPGATSYARAHLSDTLNRWETLGLVSAYHAHMRDKQKGDRVAQELGREGFGEESQPTVFGKRNGRDWKYHVDYIFADSAFVRPKAVRTWETMKSDHAPVLATFELVRGCGSQ